MDQFGLTSVLLQLTARLFNATIVAADGEVPVWDPSVKFFKVYRDGALKGHLYIDPYARPGGEHLCMTKPWYEWAQACALALSHATPAQTSIMKKMQAMWMV